MILDEPDMYILYHKCCQIATTSLTFFEKWVIVNMDFVLELTSTKTTPC